MDACMHACNSLDLEPQRSFLQLARLNCSFIQNKNTAFGKLGKRKRGIVHHGNPPIKSMGSPGDNFSHGKKLRTVSGQRTMFHPNAPAWKVPL